jgi:Putative addiction module component
MQIPIPAQSTSSIAANFDKVLEKTRVFFMETASQSLKAYEAEIEKRLAEHRANPEDVVPWEIVKANLNMAFKPATKDK